jgi:hypothetical protein
VIAQIAATALCAAEPANKRMEGMNLQVPPELEAQLKPRIF